MTYVKTDFREDDLLKLFDESERANDSDEYSVTLCKSNAAPIVLVGTGSGSSNVLTALYEISKMKISAVVRIGAVGSLRPEVNNVILADSGICLDLVSSRVASLPSGAKVDSDQSLSDRIASELELGGVNFLRSTVASLEAMYFFEEELEHVAKHGSAAYWDLETASVLAFGSRFGIRASSALITVSGSDGHDMVSYPPVQRFDFVECVMRAVTSL